MIILPGRARYSSSPRPLFLLGVQGRADGVGDQGGVAEGVGVGDGLDVPADGVDGLARAGLIALLREMDQALAGGAASLLRQIANPKAAEADDDKHPPDAVAGASPRPAPTTLPGIMQAFFGSRLIGHLQAALLQ